ncbi:MAG: TetR/AcrR family transcriptional regulator C-terminal domain-containing protein [Lachnospiraceae bacterium]|nr:TetR/AcrR family transcriptional regulator C-terminal domain-containing protein [Lachnospiraceae bacterium]
MTAESANHRTKQILAESLRAIMKTKKLDRITIADVVKECGVSRRAFYYHFKDIYDATWWLVEEDWKDRIDFDAEDWRGNMRELLHYFEENRDFVSAVLDSSQSQRMEELFRLKIKDSFKRYLTEADRDHVVTEQDAELLSQYYTTILTATLGGWIRGTIRCSDERLMTLVYESTEASLTRTVRTIGEYPV